MFRPVGLVAITLVVGVVGFAKAVASDATNVPLPAVSPRDLAIITPPAPTNRSPVEIFRELLAMSPVERNRALEGRSPENRERLLVKLREYRALDANERELRLQATELRWYLLPLLRTPSTNRAAWMERVPASFRPVIESRLTQWDMLTAETQTQLLGSEQAVRYLTQLGVPAPGPGKTTLDGLAVSERLAVQLGLARLDAMSGAARQEAILLFQNFFEFSPTERERALRQMSAVERAQMQQTMNEFLALPPDQRSQCVRAFERFATMAPVERREFLKNAERWETMTPVERQAWRELVRTVTIMPPLPAGFNSEEPPFPPSTPSPPRGRPPMPPGL